ncbi:adenylyl-sulfate kinase [Algoriphagus sp. SE2]|uniref:adenylyl-sulfate kinase n=1 Tax=Algoriphagus sp. SE2 TaxID=3141536 RepID=UPI0031CD56B0
MDNHIHPTIFKISKKQRSEKLNQTPRLLWFTGLSGSGKSTLANAVESRLFEEGYHTYLLDGDNVRTGLNNDLGFSDEDRIENIRRISEVSKLMMDSGIIVLSAFISPFQKDRELISNLVGEDNYIEIFVDCPIEVCEARDVKGLYAKARKGLIKDFTGIDSPYEEPTNPFLHIHSDREKLNFSVDQIINAVKEKLSF